MDFLTKKKKINEGEIQQYYIEGSHPVIISPKFFDLVQKELEKRKGKKRSTAGVVSIKLAGFSCVGISGGNIEQAGVGEMCDYKTSNLMELLDIIL